MGFVCCIVDLHPYGHALLRASCPHRCSAHNLVPAAEPPARACSFLKGMCGQGAQVCSDMLASSADFLAQRPGIAKLQQLLARLGYDAVIGPADALRALRDHASASPIVPELFVRPRVEGGGSDLDGPSVALQVASKYNCFRCVRCCPFNCLCARVSDVHVCSLMRTSSAPRHGSCKCLPSCSHLIKVNKCGGHKQRVPYVLCIQQRSRRGHARAGRV